MLKNCLTCAKRKAYGAAKDPLHPIPTKHPVWGLIVMDVVGPITKSRNGNNYLLVLHDISDCECKGNFGSEYLVK